MSVNTITLDLPSDLYERLRQIAADSRRPVENLILEAVSHQLSINPSDLDSAALGTMSEVELWAIVQQRMPAEKGLRFQQLLQENKMRQLTEEENTELDELLALSENLTLLRSKALSLLQEHGFDVSSYVSG